MVNRREAVSDISPQSDAIKGVEGQVSGNQRQTTIDNAPDAVEDGTDQSDQELSTLNGSDWLKVVLSPFPVNEAVQEQMLGGYLVPIPLWKSVEDRTRITDDPNKLENFARNFATWTKLFDLARLSKQDVLDVFTVNMQEVLNLKIRPGVPEGFSPQGSVYIFADNFPAKKFGETLLFPLRERGFTLETAFGGQSEGPKPVTFATFSKPFNRHAWRG